MKIIRVSGCHECDKKKMLSEGRYCSSLPSSTPIINKYIEEYIASQTVHPDCPLEEEK